MVVLLNPCLFAAAEVPWDSSRHFKLGVSRQLHVYQARAALRDSRTWLRRLRIRTTGASRSALRASRFPGCTVSKPPNNGMGH